MKFEKILITTDFSDDSYAAFDLPAYEALTNDTEVTLLHVVEDWQVPPELMHQIANPESLSQYQEDLVKASEEKLNDLAKTKLHNINCSTVVQRTHDSVGKTIAEYANKNDFGLIVLSSHGRGALGTLIMGSVVQKILQTANCPVMVVPKT